jgi:hypothetical protein
MDELRHIKDEIFCRDRINIILTQKRKPGEPGLSSSKTNL